MVTIDRAGELLRGAGKESCLMKNGEVSCDSDGERPSGRLVELCGISIFGGGVQEIDLQEIW